MLGEVIQERLDIDGGFTAFGEHTVEGETGGIALFAEQRAHFLVEAGAHAEVVGIFAADGLGDEHVHGPLAGDPDGRARWPDQR